MKFPRSHEALQRAGVDFLQKCLNYDASRRPSATTLLTHELVHKHGVVYRGAVAAAAQPPPTPPGVSADAAVVQPASAAETAQAVHAAPADASKSQRRDLAQAESQADKPEAAIAEDSRKCNCSGNCKGGKKAHGDDGCQSPSSDGSRFCPNCRCKAVKREALLPPNDLEYSSGDESAHVPKQRCSDGRSRGDTCYRHRHAKLSLVLKACRRLGRFGLLDLLVPCDVEVFLKAPIHDDLVLQLIGAWLKHPVAIEALARSRPRGSAYSAAALMKCLHGVLRP